MTGHVHFIGGEKGGVGKSFVSRLLAQYVIDQQQPLLAFDSDPSHRTFSRFYGEFATSINVADYTSLDSVVEAAEEASDAQIIVDLAAQTAAPLHQWAKDTDVFAIFEDLGFEVYVWHVMDDSADSANLLGEQLEAFQELEAARNKVRMVVVKNYGRGQSFGADEQVELLSLAQQQGAFILDVPELHSVLAQKVDFSGTSFWAAANNREVMTLTERHRVKVWLRDIRASLDLLFGNSEAQPQTPFQQAIGRVEPA